LEYMVGLASEEKNFGKLYFHVSEISHNLSRIGWPTENLRSLQNQTILSTLKRRVDFSEVTGACGEQFDPELTAEGPWPSRKGAVFS